MAMSIPIRLSEHAAWQYRPFVNPIAGRHQLPGQHSASDGPGVGWGRCLVPIYR